MREQINALKEKRAKLFEEMRDLTVAAESEDRDLTAEEAQEFDRKEKDAESLESRAGRLEQMIEVEPRKVSAQQREEREDEPVASFAEFRERRSGGAPQDRPEYREQFYGYLVTGEQPRDEEVRALSKATAAAGANLVPTDFESSVIALIKEFGVMAQLADEFTTDSGEEIKLPTETTAGVAAWTAENAAFNESDDAFGQASLNAYKATRVVKVSEELLSDSAYDLESHLQRSFGRAFGILENTAYVVGDAASKPTGITTQTTAGKTGAAGQTTTVTADDLMDLYHSVLSPYRRNGAWLLGDGSIKAIRKLKTGVTGDNTYLWQPGLQAGQPDTLLGRPVHTDPDMPAMAASAKSILFGDFSAYKIRRARGVALQRLTELYSANGQVGFRGFIRVDGKLVDTAAVKHYANSAT
ncbi:MAG: phage major capsid protein [Actinomycetota bacterium]|nr:phage major capsid protein [Actinomycetota bacterium]